MAVTFAAKEAADETISLCGPRPLRRGRAFLVLLPT